MDFRSVLVIKNTFLKTAVSFTSDVGEIGHH
jgi:hypothetical protein